MLKKLFKENTLENLRKGIWKAHGNPPVFSPELTVVTSVYSVYCINIQPLLQNANKPRCCVMADWYCIGSLLTSWLHHWNK
jgi:hypothetical protein